jgi:hypothetical protein
MKVQRQLFIVYYIYCIIIVPYVLATDILFFIMLSRYRQTVSPYLLVHTSSKIFIVDYNYCIIIATYTLATVLPRTTRSILENYPPKSRALSTDVQTSLVWIMQKYYLLLQLSARGGKETSLEESFSLVSYLKGPMLQNLLVRKLQIRAIS